MEYLQLGHFGRDLKLHDSSRGLLRHVRKLCLSGRVKSAATRAR
jgi:hypothetical protein